jgi:hypothetical protein
MGVISEAGTAYPSGAAVFTPVFSGVRVTRYLVFCVVFCRSSFCHFVLSSLSHLGNIFKEEFEDTKGAIRFRNSQKDRQHNG